MPVKTQKQKQSQIVQVIIGAEILKKLVKKPKKKKVKSKSKPIESFEEFYLREPYRRNRYMKPLKYKQTFPAYGANNMIMQQTENQRNNRILSDLQQRVNQYERLLKQRPNPINKFIIREAQEIKEEDIPQEVVEETERLEQELEEEEIDTMLQDDELQELSKGDDIEEAEQIMREIDESLKKGSVKKRVKDIEEGMPEPSTPPNEPEQLEPGSFGGRPQSQSEIVTNKSKIYESLEPVQAIPVPTGEGLDIPEVGFPEDFPPPPVEESKGAEEAETVEFIDIPKPTEFNARYNLLDEVEKAEFMKKFPRFFRSTAKGNLSLRADGSLRAQTITVNKYDKERLNLDTNKLTLKGDKIDEAKKFLLKKLLDKNKKMEKEAKKKAKNVDV